MFKHLFPYYVGAFCLGALLTSPGALVATLLPFLRWSQETFGVALSLNALGSVLGGLAIGRCVTIRNHHLFFVMTVLANIIGYLCVFALSPLAGAASSFVAMFGFLLAGVAACGFITTATTRIFDGGSGAREFGIMQLCFAGGLMAGPLLATLLAGGAHALASTTQAGQSIRPIQFKSVYLLLALELECVIYVSALLLLKKTSEQSALPAPHEAVEQTAKLAVVKSIAQDDSQPTPRGFKHLIPMALAALGIMAFRGVESCLFGWGVMWAQGKLGFTAASGGLMMTAFGVGFFTARLVVLNWKTIAPSKLATLLTVCILTSLCLVGGAAGMAGIGARHEIIYQVMFFALGLMLGNNSTWSVVSMYAFYSGKDATRQANRVTAFAPVGVIILPFVTGKVVHSWGLGAFPLLMVSVLGIAAISYGVLAIYGKRSHIPLSRS